MANARGEVAFTGVKRRLWRYLLLSSYAVVLFASGALVALAGAAIFYVNSKPDLSVWHTAWLDEEFTAHSGLDTFADYLALEERLFLQLKSEVYDEIDAAERTSFNRYFARSRSDPDIWTPNWNRTFELAEPDAAFGVLLLHGYSDSPYSLRGFGAMMHEAGAHVLGLRIPGHGTAPSALKHTVAADMTAAVRLAMAHLKSVMGDRPLIVIGYSNGAALALNYELEAIEDATLPVPAGLVLMSPEIGVSPMAAYASWQARIGELLRLDKLGWNTVLPEFDPFKYGSFAVNAGEQAYLMTQQIRTRLDRLARDGRLGEVAPILAFQSAVDATVLASAVVTGLFDRLPSGRHELVIFDVNRFYEAQGLLAKPINLESLLAGRQKAYSIGIVTNRASAGPEAVLKFRPAGKDSVTIEELGASWPEDVYSLSHIALPFSPDDPLYGDDPQSLNPGIRLGTLALHGENGALLIPPTMMTRQRWNPFHSFMAAKIQEFVRERVGRAPG
jgi:alpha-beta hydrolase superfamily lysophospholipase